MLDDGERAIRTVAGEGPDALLARADRLHGERGHVDAANTYLRAIDTAPPEWPSRSRAIESLLLARWAARDLEACTRDAVRLVGGMPRAPSFANASALGLLCAVSAERAPWLAERLGPLQALAREAVGLPGVLADDRSGLFELLVEANKLTGNAAAAHELATQWLQFLRQQIEQTKDPELRAAFDSHYLSASLALGQPQHAVERLLVSERELPDDYNAPARLAVAYRELGRLEDAEASARRALGKVYGPRKLRVLQSLADIQKRRDDVEGARRTLQEARVYAESLPAEQRPRGIVEALDGQLTALPKAPGGR